MGITVFGIILIFKKDSYRWGGVTLKEEERGGGDKVYSKVISEMKTQKTPKKPKKNIYIYHLHIYLSSSS